MDGYTPSQSVTASCESYPVGARSRDDAPVVMSNPDSE